MKSGEAYIQQYMDEAGQVKTPKRQNDHSDRATVEQVLDERTLLILFHLLGRRQDISKINGCISTGKEANVYHVCHFKFYFQKFFGKTLLGTSRLSGGNFEILFFLVIKEKKPRGILEVS